MKQLIITAFTVLTVLAAKAQKQEIREAKTATAIEVENGIALVITQSDTPALKAEADNTEALHNVITEYKKGVLKIYLKHRELTTMNTANYVKVYVSQKSISDIKARNGASVKLNGKLLTGDINIKLDGGSSFNGEISATGTCSIKASAGSGYRGILNTLKLEGNALGGGVIKVLGSARLATLYSSGGTIQAGKLICTSTNVIAQNGSTVFVNASEYIKADTDGSSTVTYYGAPKKAVTGNNTYSVIRDAEKLTLN